MYLFLLCLLLYWGNFITAPGLAMYYVLVELLYICIVTWQHLGPFMFVCGCVRVHGYI